MNLREAGKILQRIEDKLDQLRELPELPTDVDESIQNLQKEVDLIWQYLGGV